MRLVLDTNVLVSAFLWEGLPGRLIALADEQVITLYTSRVLLDELSVVLQRGKFTRRVQATGLSAAQLVRHYQRLAHRISVRQLTQRISRDADDDQVLACALAAKADLIVSGDRDLLDLNEHLGVRIVTAAQALRIIAGD
ncbi:MAG: putative toxin-antitoxin system toxin component, PIN family [Gammaproteobacteria bacterium]